MLTLASRGNQYGAIPQNVWKGCSKARLTATHSGRTESRPVADLGRRYKIMTWMDALSGVLKQYTGAAAAQAPGTVHQDFDQITQTAPHSAIADGLTEAFRSDQTPAFEQMAAQLFSQSNGTQRAGILNTLMGAVGPSVMASVLGGRTASILGGGQDQITPEQAQQLSPEQVQRLASEAQKRDPSIMDQFGSFYAQHPALVKTLGGAALAVIISRISQQRGG